MTARLIDDADPRVIKEGNWGVGGDSNEFDGTLSYTTTVGDSLKLVFKGSYIAVFGLYDNSSEGVVTNYTIDGASPTQVTTPPAATDVLRQQFWIKKGLAPGSHTLQITMDKLNVEPNSTNQFSGTIWFDYFQVDNSNTDVPSVTQWNFSTGSPQPTPSSQGHNSQLPIGAIIGIVIGALFFLLGLAFLFLMWRRMRRESRIAPSREKRHSLRQSLIEPFLLSQHAPEPSASSTQIAAASSSEPLLFDPSLFVRGPPGVGNHKSTIMSVIQNPDSAPPSVYPRPQSIGASSTVGSSRGTLPPGAQPPTIPPVPHLPLSQRSSTRPTTAQSAMTSASHTSNPDSSADDALTVTLVPSSPIGTAIVPDGEEDTGSTSPTQHVDSGVREPGVILAHSSRQKRVELPPVYSPT